MKYGSVCSGIEAATTAWIGKRIQEVSEIINQQKDVENK
jgi:hypothetical protein